MYLYVCVHVECVYGISGERKNYDLMEPVESPGRRKTSHRTEDEERSMRYEGTCLFSRRDSNNFISFDRPITDANRQTS